MMSNQTYQLNPFVFPTETDGRFLLLIFVVAGGWFNLLRWLLFAYTDLSDLATGLISLIGTFLLFVWTRRRAQEVAPRKIADADVQLLADVKPSPHFEQMSDYIKQTVFNLPDVIKQTPQFLWQAGHIVSGQAIGYGRQQYVLLFEGLLPAFVLSFSTFRTVLLHELAHIANRDVSKTTFSIELGKMFYKTAVVTAILLNLWASYQMLDRLVFEASLLPIWEGFVLFFEMNLKLALIILLIEAVRSSVLRAREYDADARAAIWLGRYRSQLVQVLQGNGKKKPPHTSRNWHEQLRRKYMPLHPTSAERVAALQNSRTLFVPRASIIFFSGLLVGFALNGNIAWAVTAFIEISRVESILFYLLAFVILFGSVVFFGLIPLVQVAGVQMQKAAFADLAQPTEPLLLSKYALAKQAGLLSSGLIAGFLLTPIPSGLSIASVAVGFRAIGLVPFFWLGWTAVFLLWIFALHSLWQQFYAAQQSGKHLEKRRKYLAAWATAVLFPTFAAMAWTQLIVGQWIGGGADFANPAFGEAVVLFVGTAWLLAIPLHVAFLIGGRHWFRQQGWLADQDQPMRQLPPWVRSPQFEPLPKPAQVAAIFSSTLPPL